MQLLRDCAIGKATFLPLFFSFSSRQSLAVFIGVGWKLTYFRGWTSMSHPSIGKCDKAGYQGAMSHSHLTEKKSMKFELRFRSLVWVKIEEISKLRCPRCPKAQVILTWLVASYTTSRNCRGPVQNSSATSSAEKGSFFRPTNMCFFWLCCWKFQVFLSIFFAMGIIQW